MVSPLKKTSSTRLGYGEDDMTAKITSFVAQQLGAGGVRWCWVRPRQVEIGTPIMDVTNNLPLRLCATVPVTVTPCAA